MGSEPSNLTQQLCNQGHKYADIILQWAESWMHIDSKVNNIEKIISGIAALPDRKKPHLNHV